MRLQVTSPRLSFVLALALPLFSRSHPHLNVSDYTRHLAQAVRMHKCAGDFSCCARAALGFIVPTLRREDELKPSILSVHHRQLPVTAAPVTRHPARLHKGVADAGKRLCLRFLSLNATSLRHYRNKTKFKRFEFCFYFTTIEHRNVDGWGQLQERERERERERVCVREGESSGEMPGVRIIPGQNTAKRRTLHRSSCPTLFHLPALCHTLAPDAFRPPTTLKAILLEKLVYKMSPAQIVNAPHVHQTGNHVHA